MSRPFVVAALALVAAASPAHAHAGQTQAGRAAFLADGAVVGGGTTWGIVSPEGDHFARVCEESLGLSVSFYHRRSDGAIIMGVVEQIQVGETVAGLKITRDDGCTNAFIETAPFHGSLPNALAVHPDGRLFVVTNQNGLPNGIYASDDEGDSWSEVLPPVAGLQLYRIIISPDGQTIIATGDDTSADRRRAVYVSNDGGDSFEDFGLSYPYYLVLAVGWDLAGTSALMGGYQLNEDNDTEGIVVRVARDTPDQPELIGTTPASIDFVAPLGDTIFALSKLQATVYKKGPDDAEFVEATGPADGPTDCLTVHPDGGLLGCGQDQVLDRGAFMHSDDGVTWTPLLEFEDIDFRICPAGDVGFALCADKFESSCGNGGDEDNDSLVDCQDPDCARRCAEGEGEEGEGELPFEGEGEGEAGEGEGEGEAPTCACHATGARPWAALSLLGLVAVARRRLR